MILRLILYFLLGSVIGSFLRCYTQRSSWSLKQFITGRSQCDHCHTSLQRYELLPVISYVIQWGKCRYCQKPIAKSHLRAELWTWLIFMIVWNQIIFYSFLSQLLLFTLLWSLVLIAMIDIKKKELSLLALLFALSFLGLNYSHFNGLETISEFNSVDIVSIGLYWFVPWLVVWLMGWMVYRLKFGTRWQGFGFGDVLFSWLLGMTCPLLCTVVFSKLVLDEPSVMMISTLGVLIHMVVSSIIGIIWFLISSSGKNSNDLSTYVSEWLPFLPYMLWWFALLAIVIYYFSDQIIGFVAL